MAWKKTWILTLCGLLLGMLAGAAAAEDKTIKMSTTTSTRDSGLLDILLPEFKKDTGIEVQYVAKGTGAAIMDGQDGNVDVIFVHSPPQEEAFIKAGWGTKRYAVMHNDFVLLGPPADPAGIKGMKDAAGALKKIAEKKAAFISRGDKSGTHAKEIELWKATGLPMETTKSALVKGGKTTEISFERPAGDWYLSIGQGMGKALIMSDEKKAYVLSDRATFINYTLGRDKPIDLAILCEGDPVLFNPYGVIPVNPEKHKHVKYDLAKTFSEWLVSARGQAAIANYKLHGKQLFMPDAIPDAK